MLLGRWLVVERHRRLLGVLTFPLRTSCCNFAAERITFRPAFSSALVISSSFAKYASGSAANSRDNSSLIRQTSSRIGLVFIVYLFQNIRQKSGTQM